MTAPITVVVLNWNGADDTLECLESLRRSTVAPNVVVVDNGSTDGSVERIRASGLADVLLETGANLGYAAGNNVGVQFALDSGAPVIAVLNNDTVVDPPALAALLAHLPASERRAVAPDIRYFDRPDESWFAGGVIEHGWTRHLQRDELPRGDAPLRPSEWLSGCCFAARREIWERVGLFDQGFFILFEDSDWSLRAVRAGVDLAVVGDAVIRHKVSRTFAPGMPLSVLGAFYFVRNGLRFDWRYFRGDVPGFARRWLVGRLPPVELGFRWLGALAFLLGQRGRAPRLIEGFGARLAGSR